MKEEKAYLNLTVHLTDKKQKKRLISLIFSYLQLRNFLLILIKRNSSDHLAHPKASPNLFTLLINFRIMRGFLAAQPGGKERDKVQSLEAYYARDSMASEAKELGQRLKDKIIAELVKQISQNFKSYFALRKIDPLARPPKAKRLKSVLQYSLPIDMECVSFKRKNSIALKLSKDKPLHLYVNHQSLLDSVGDFKRIKRMELSFKQYIIDLPRISLLASSVIIKPSLTRRLYGSYTSQEKVKRLPFRKGLPEKRE